MDHIAEENLNRPQEQEQYIAAYKLKLAQDKRAQSRQSRVAYEDRSYQEKAEKTDRLVTQPSRELFKVPEIVIPELNVSLEELPGKFSFSSAQFDRMKELVNQLEAISKKLVSSKNEQENSWAESVEESINNFRDSLSYNDVFPDLSDSSENNIDYFCDFLNNDANLYGLIDSLEDGFVYIDDNDDLKKVADVGKELTALHNKVISDLNLIGHVLNNGMEPAPLHKENIDYKLKYGRIAKQIQFTTADQTDMKQELTELAEFCRTQQGQLSKSDRFYLHDVIELANGCRSDVEHLDHPSVNNRAIQSGLGEYLISSEKLKQQQLLDALRDAAEAVEDAPTAQRLIGFAKKLKVYDSKLIADRNMLNSALDADHYQEVQPHETDFDNLESQRSAGVYPPQITFETLPKEFVEEERKKLDAAARKKVRSEQYRFNEDIFQRVTDQVDDICFDYSAEDAKGVALFAASAEIGGCKKDLFRNEESDEALLAQYRALNSMKNIINTVRTQSGRESLAFIEADKCLNHDIKLLGDELRSKNLIEQQPSVAASKIEIKTETAVKPEPAVAPVQANVDVDDYMSELTRLTNDLAKTDSKLSKDSNQYKNVKSALNTEIILPVNASTEQKREALQTKLENVLTHINQYKQQHLKGENLPLNDRRLRRLKTMNRIERLYLNLKNNTVKPSQEIKDKFAEKMVQADMIQRITSNGPDASKARDLMLDTRALHSAINAMKETEAYRQINFPGENATLAERKTWEDRIRTNGQKLLAAVQKTPAFRAASVSRLNAPAAQQVKSPAVEAAFGAIH